MTPSQPAVAPQTHVTVHNTTVVQQPQPQMVMMQQPVMMQQCAKLALQPAPLAPLASNLIRRVRIPSGRPMMMQPGMQQPVAYAQPVMAQAQPMPMAGYPQQGGAVPMGTPLA